MKRMWLVALLAASCGAPEIEIATTTHPLVDDPQAAVADRARDDGNSNPMPGRPPSSAAAPPTNPVASNPMPGTPAPVADPLAPGASNPMPGVNAVVDYTK